MSKSTLASILLTLITTLFLSTSCQRKNTSDTNVAEENENSKASFSVDSLHISRNIDSLMLIDYDIHFLNSENIASDSINAKINESCISGKHNANISQAIEESIAYKLVEFKQQIDEFYDPDDETYGEITFHYSIKGRFSTDAADSVIVYNFSIDLYTGGAHGSYIPFTLNFSKNSGRIINISDVLDTAQEKAILDLMLAQLLDDNNCTTREELMEKTGLLALNELYLTENFHLGENNITFCFGQYDIAPYSSDITYVSLSYKDLGPYLK